MPAAPDDTAAPERAPALPQGHLRPASGGPQDVFYNRDSDIPLPLIVRAEGVYMWDDAGNRYLDVSSGPVVSNIGHGNARVADAMAAQAKTMDFAYSRVTRHRPNMDLAERIAALAGPGFERVALASGGSEAMDLALKFLRQRAVAFDQPDRTKMISCMPSYHGSTVATLELTGDEAMDPFLDGFVVRWPKVPAPWTYRVPRNHTAESWARHCAAELERTIVAEGPETILGFAVEPVGGLATGCTVLSDTYVRAVREICTRHGIALVFDEVLCGTGRTGRFLAAHHWPDALPDIVVMAKGLGSGYAPMAAMLVPAAWADPLAEKLGFSYSHTYNANPVSCAATLAVLDEYARLDLVAAAAERGAELRAGLWDLAERIPVIGDVRGLGLLLGVEIVADRDTKRSFGGGIWPTEVIRRIGLDHGLLIYTRRTANGRNGDWLMISPPLTITSAEIAELLDRLEATLRAFMAEANAP